MNQRGTANVLGLLAVLAATAVVITVVMLLVTGVAQRSILPRLKSRAEQAVPEATEVSPTIQEVVARTSVGEPVATSAADSLRALRSQLRLEQDRLAERESELQQAISEWRLLREADEGDVATRIAALAKIYSSMKPEAAARVLVRLDDETFERVLAKIDKRQAGKILSLIDPERVARLTRRASRTGLDGIS